MQITAKPKCFLYLPSTTSLTLGISFIVYHQTIPTIVTEKIADQRKIEALSASLNLASALAAASPSKILSPVMLPFLRKNY